MKYLVTVDFWKQVIKRVMLGQSKWIATLSLNKGIYYVEDRLPRENNLKISIDDLKITIVDKSQIPTINNSEYNDEHILWITADIKKYHFSHQLIYIPAADSIESADSYADSNAYSKDPVIYDNKTVDLSKSIDPMEMLKNTAKNNLQLIKYRNAPSIDLDKIYSTRCLIIGTGTLGCNIARNLLMWGIEHISFIDNANVSNSNLLRQTLYEYSDIDQPKAIAAAKRIELIYPPAKGKVKGYNFNIPMPDHPFGGTLEDLAKDLDFLDKLIEEHDVIFLCTDNKESRWLPTVISICKDKLVINIAVGFDEWVIMRHPLKSPTTGLKSSNDLSVDQFGCYFCISVEGVENTMIHRQIDEKCTVTRGGTSSISCGYAIELLISLLNHPLQHKASARVNCIELGEFALNYPPQQMRGNVNLYKSQHGLVRRNPQCCACSKYIVDFYSDPLTRVKFIHNVCQKGQTLTNVTGLDKYILSSSNDNLVEVD